MRVATSNPHEAFHRAWPVESVELQHLIRTRRFTANGQWRVSTSNPKRNEASQLSSIRLLNNSLLMDFRARQSQNVLRHSRHRRESSKLVAATAPRNADRRASARMTSPLPTSCSQDPIALQIMPTMPIEYDELWQSRSRKAVEWSCLVAC